MASSTVTRASEAARRYATALFELAQDKGILADIHSEYAEFVDTAKASKDLTHLMASPAISREDKTAALSALAKKAGVHEIMGKFLGAMAANGRAHEIVSAQGAFDELYAKQRGVKRAVVRTAKDMSEAERLRIEGILAKAVGGDVELTSEVDASLVGGIQLRIGSQLVDASLASKLDRMNTAMKGA